MKLIAEAEPGSHAPRPAAGVVFHARMLGGLRVEHIGIPFEHRGRTFAVHRSTVAGPLKHAAYEVSDAETGWSLEGIRGDSVEAAHAAALDAFALFDDKQWRRMIQRAVETA